MRVCKTYEFEGGIKGFRLGWSAVGPPLMSVYFYLYDRLMVDTGQAHMGPEVLKIARENRVERIVLTHHHEDHSGNAALVHGSTGARVFGHELTRAKMETGYPILPYQKYVWGKTTPVGVAPLPEHFDTGLGPMIPVHTPGHSRDHTSYFLPDRGVLFTGDLYLGDRIKFFRSDEDLGAEVDSLKKVMELDFEVLLCNHNPRKEKGKEHIRLKLDFMENLYGSIVGLYKEGCGEKEIFSRLKLKEDYFTKWVCFGNVSMMNGVRSVIRHHETAAN
ncbi:MAG: MBL fold metallo-hydrolase [Desulfobacterales bacterium]|nr:MBL fold metallo-hydrolase [Desulfobacterales bacterium]